MALSTEGWSHLEPKVKTLWRVQAAITGTIITLISLPIDIFLLRSEGKFIIPIGVIPGTLALLIIALPIFLAGRKYEMYKYRLGEDDLSVAHGIFWRTMRFINRARIQHVDIAAGPIARKLGLCDMSVYVGGQVGAAVQIPGLSPEAAERIRESLLRTGRVTQDLPPSVPPLAEPPPLS